MKRIFFILLAVLCIMDAQAQGRRKSAKINPPRPKVGIVLGGGGAKGAAHIGVLKYLEEIGMPIDYVAGTSMGSIIGGLYAMGYSPDELAVLIANMNWSEYVGNSINRSAMSKEFRQRSSTMLVNIPFNLDGLFHQTKKKTSTSILPNAYVNNTSLINLFNDLCIGYQKEMDFNDLPIPFACVATDIKTGEEVVIREGSVPTAMRASMAIPGVFSPVIMQNRLLVDGGLVNNFPADVLQEMGADIIIGVEVSDSDSLYVDEAVSILEILNSLVNNAVSSKRAENQAKCTVYLAPDISGYGTLSFTPEAIDTLVHRGYQKAKENQEALIKVKHYIDTKSGHLLTKQLRAHKAKNLSDDPVFISSITINQNGDPNSEWLIRKGGLRIGQFMSEKDIKHAIDIYRGTGAFDDITYNIIESDPMTMDTTLIDTYSLIINFKPTQPHIFGLGIRYDTEEGAAMLLNIGINEKKLSGFKLNMLGRLSYNPRFKLTATYSKISLANFNLAYEYRSQHFKALVTDKKYSNLHYDQHQISSYISQFHILNFNTAVGISYAFTSFDRVSPLDFVNDSIDLDLISNSYFNDNRRFGPYFTVNYDNLDANYFARHGINTTLGGHLYFDPSDKTHSAGDIAFSLQAHLTPRNGKFTIIPQLYSRWVIGKNLYANYWNIIGGEIPGRHADHQMPFIGVSHIDEVPDWSTVLRCDLRYNFYEKHYLTAMYNFLYGFYPLEPSHDNDRTGSYSGIGLRYSYDTYIGPITFTTQWSNYTKQFSSYFSIGYIF